MVQNFQKISGYKVISKCRNCGARSTGKTSTSYCPTCLDKLRKYRDEEDVKRLKEDTRKKDEAKRKEAKRDAAEAKRDAKATEALKKKTVKKASLKSKSSKRKK